jgi:ABC-type nitrate/sulfonate/bicarbonate transport system ATPase subunit
MIMSRHPGRVKEIVEITAPRPREDTDPEVSAIVEEINDWLMRNLAEDEGRAASKQLS